MGVGVGLLISPDLRGGGGSGGPRDRDGTVEATVFVRRGGGIILAPSSFTSDRGRPWSKDRRTGTSGGAGRCICTLFLKSALSFSRLTGRAGRSSWLSPFRYDVFVGGEVRFGGWLAILDSVTASFSATAWCTGGGGK